MRTRLDAIIINGLIKDNPIDNEIKFFLKIKEHIYTFSI